MVLEIMAFLFDLFLLGLVRMIFPPREQVKGNGDSYIILNEPGGGDGHKEEGNDPFLNSEYDAGPDW